jgi:4-hydroxybenzoate polyprenyltransferase
MKRTLSPGRKATAVFCALVLGTGVIALALLGPLAAVPAIIGSLLIAAPLTVIAYVIFLKSEDRELETPQ